MSATTTSTSRRAAIDRRRGELVAVLRRYHVSNIRLFGSVARGDARPQSDIDVIVDLESGHGNDLLRVAGIGHEFAEILGVPVDVVTESLLRHPVSESALADAIRL